MFYDKNEQARIIANNIEDYLKPIYSSGAAFVICLLSYEYPKRVWTKFESEQFKERFANGQVIPVWFTNAQPGVFDVSSKVGGFMFDPDEDVEKQLRDLVSLLLKKLENERLQKAVQLKIEFPSVGGF